MVSRARTDKERDYQRRWIAADRVKNPKKHREYRNKWASQNRDALKIIDRRWNLKKKYGITLEEYEELHEGQEGLCAICKSPPPKDKHLAVDHCHATGKNRALLCGNCNTALGMVKENTQTLTSMVGYINEHNGKQTTK